MDKSPIVVRFAGERIETKLRKLGAIVGDHSEVACDVVWKSGTEFLSLEISIFF